MAGRGAGVLGVGFWVLGVTFSLDSGFRRNDGDTWFFGGTVGDR